MKKKSLLLSVFVLCIISGGFSSGVDVKKASLVARNFYYGKANLDKSGLDYNALVWDQTYTKSARGLDDYFVFTLPGKGYVIVSAEDILQPVIGYSFDAVYVDKDQPDSYRNFMQSYSDEIAYIRSNTLTQSAEIKALWDYYSSPDPTLFDLSKDGKSVEPLITSKWNQSYPYNYYCPVDPNGSGGHVYAGCVATAMAQVMYYWRYPMQGTGSHSYYYPPYGNLSANFGETTYEWEGMQNSIDHDNVGPIALLQYHCGIAVDMMYGPNGSGAYSNDVPPALVSYFGYSSDCYFTWKDNHTNAEWVSMLTGNLDNGFPMYYSGFSSAGGHAFVCDGYQDDYFHFNFGWSGQSDGYYTLSTVGGFNDGQGAVFDTYPESGYPYYCSGDHQISMISGSIADGSGPVENYQNNVSCSWLFTPQTGEDSISNISITFKKFDTEINDKVRIYDGSSIQDNLLGEFSGSGIPTTVTTTGNEMLVVFESDGAGSAAGWLAEYTAHTPDYCHGVVTLNDAYGSLTDGSGTFNYHNSTVCMWKIMPVQAQSVTINFTSFKTEAISDRVRIYDLESQELLAEYSGNYSSGNLPAPVTSPSGQMFIAFSTNSSVTSEGWDAYYTSIMTGIEDTPVGDRILNVYPNPARESVTLEITGQDCSAIKLDITSSTGTKVYSAALNDSGSAIRHSVDVSEFPKGIYFVRITDRKNTLTRKFIVQ
jgi:hypothetical protein